jgi:hypothetical protein
MVAVPRTLTRAERMQWSADGFLVRRAVFAAPEVAAMRAALARLERVADGLGPGPPKRSVDGVQYVVDHLPDGANRLHRAVWVAAGEPILDRLGRDPRLVEVAGDLLDADTLTQLICQAHFKRPGDGVAFPWHQDSAHRRYGTELWRDPVGDGAFVQSLVALDPVHPASGGLAMVPGSHRLGHLGVRPEVVPEDWGGGAPAFLELAPGDVAWWSAFLVHGSAANAGSRARRVFVNGYARPGANRRVYPGVGLGRTVRVWDGAVRA